MMHLVADQQIKRRAQSFYPGPEQKKGRISENTKRSQNVEQENQGEDQADNQMDLAANEHADDQVYNDQD